MSTGSSFHHAKVSHILSTNTMKTEEERMLSSAWSQLAELGYHRENEVENLNIISSQYKVERNDLGNLSDAFNILLDDLAPVDDSIIDDSDDSSTDDLIERIKNISQMKTNPSNKVANQLLLSQIASMHFGNSESINMVHMSEVEETRSSLSSPGKSNFTIRQRLSQMPRKERREVLMTQDLWDSKENEETNSLTSQKDDELNLKANSVKIDDSLMRLKRQIHYGQYRKEPLADRGTPNNAFHAPRKIEHAVVTRTTNRILIHVYDLFSSDTLMQLPWGCVCEIGKCFTQVNTALLTVGTGIYHVGIEVNGIEYAYGATKSYGKTGVFSCIPKTSPGYQYRTTIDFGDVPLIRRAWVSVPCTSKENSKVSDASESSSSTLARTSFQLVEEFIDGRQIIREMTSDYMGIDYDLLRKNCCSFAHDACLRLGLLEEQVPSWFRNLAETGAMTQDVANAAIVQPINKVFSGFDTRNKSGSFGRNRHSHQEAESGFEVVRRRNASNTQDVLVVLNSEPHHTEESQVTFARTTTWAY